MAANNELKCQKVFGIANFQSNGLELKDIFLKCECYY
jgi:hypothetical protein